MKPTKIVNIPRNEHPNLRAPCADLHMTRSPSRHAHGSRHGSIEEYIQRLKLMVPNIRTDEKLDELEILQRVIEYIQLLENALKTTRTPRASTVALE